MNKQKMIVLTGRWDSIPQDIKTDISQFDLLCSKAHVDLLASKGLSRQQLFVGWKRIFSMRDSIRNSARFFKKYEEVMILYNNPQGAGYFYINLLGRLCSKERLWIICVDGKVKLFHFNEWMRKRINDLSFFRKIFSSLIFLANIFILFPLKLCSIYFFSKANYLTRNNRERHLLFISGLLFLKGRGVVVRPRKFLKDIGSFDWKTTVVTTFFENSEPREKETLLTSSKDIFIEDSSPKQKNILKFLEIPDHFISWLPYAVLKGMDIIKKNNIKVIFATAKPYTNLLIAMVLKRMTNLWTVIEFRDEWANLPFIERSTFRRKIELLMEEMVINSADSIITNTKGQDRAFKEKYSYIPQERFVLVPNGFDSDDFKNIRRDNLIEQVLFSFIGTLSPIRTFQYLLAAVEKICEQQPMMQEKLRFRMVGFFPPQEKSLIINSRFGYLFDIKEALNHEDAVKYMQDTDVLIAISNENSHRYIAGKTYEYLFSGRPVLGLVPRGGDTENLLNTYGVSECASPNDIEAISEALMKCYTNIVNGKWSRIEAVTNRRNLNKFERKYLTQQVSFILERGIN